MIRKIGNKIGGGLGLNEIHKHLGEVHHDVNEGEARLERMLEGQAERLVAIERRLAEIEEAEARIERTNGERMKSLAKQSSLQYESLATISGGAVKDSQERFFKTIAPARGELRIYQLGCAKLLHKLAEICRKNRLRLWICSGTLLGAVRNRGFIPWDDDADTLMMRDDIKKLRRILERDPEYQLALNYDYYCNSRQLRFRTREANNPCFVDVFIQDYSFATDGEKFTREWERKKRAAIEKFERNDSPAMQAWRKKGVIGEHEEFGAELGRLFEMYYPDPETPKDTAGAGVYWSLDNLDPGGERLFRHEVFFPAAMVEFEGEKYPAPRDYDQYLKQLYGDYYALPSDLGLQFQHVDRKKWDIGAVERFLQRG